VLRTDINVSEGLRPARDVTGRVVLLSPSCGLGGGIERYLETLEWAFSAKGVPYQRVDLSHRGPGAHARMLKHARELLRGSPAPTRLVVAHRALLPVASLLARDISVRGISVLCHGCDVWDARFRPNRYVESRLMRRPSVRVVAVSSFTAGAIARLSPAAILPPGLSGKWFHTLVDGSAVRQEGHPGVRIVTAFRLAAWQEKGLPQLMDAIVALRRSDVRLTVCGTGEPPPDLREAVRKYACCTLRSGLSDRELARQFAAADLFVLATRTRTGRHAYGEGFGLVLLEAQVAGTPVVGPAYGGSPDAYLDRITGVAPVDETIGALTDVLGKLLQDPRRLAEMGWRAAEWARESFAPDHYAQLVVSKLL
jgi:phosphatidylinositol alpha-1,6-mannosyltransferase